MNQASRQEQLHVRFVHGLGDCVNFAALATLYRRHGINIVVSGEDNKQFIWRAAGLDPVGMDDRRFDHPWLHPKGFWTPTDADCAAHKVGGNINAAPLPQIDAPQFELWKELCGIDLDASPHISPDIHGEAERFLEGLKPPIVAFHAIGSNLPEAKRIDAQAQIDIQRGLIDAGYSVVVLDFDSRAAQIGHERVRGIKPNWGHISLDRLAALLFRCALLIGVDSGPLHFARMFCRVPCLGVYLNKGSLLPHRISIPSPRLTNLVPSSLNEIWRDRLSLGVCWNFVDYQTDEPTAKDVINAATAVLQGLKTGLTNPVDLETLAGVYSYECVGVHSPRDLELLSNGRIGTGSAERERSWIYRQRGESGVLSLIDEYGVSTCDLEGSNGVFRGHWNRFEKMPVVLTSKSATLATNPPIATAPLKAETGILTSAEAESMGLVRSKFFWIRKGMQTEDLTVVQDIYENDAYRLGLRENDVRSARFVVDVGGHIGTFSTLVHRMNSTAKIVCVEACPENVIPLRANVASFAEIVPAACTYDSREMLLLNTVMANGGNTGGSVVVASGEEGTPDARYAIDTRPIAKVTLEELLTRFGFETIDILKLDCEGSEFSILENATCLDQVRLIVGEYHGFSRWETLRRSKFRDWDYGHMLGGDIGLFHLVNPRFKVAA